MLLVSVQLILDEKHFSKHPLTVDTHILEVSFFYFYIKKINFENKNN